MLLKITFIWILSLLISLIGPQKISAQTKNNESITKRDEVLLYIDSMKVFKDKEILKTLDFFDVAILKAKENKFKDLEAQLYFIVAGQYNLIADPDQAIDYYNKSISLYDSLGLKLEAAKAHNNLAWVYGTIGNKEKELSQFKKAFNIVKETEHKYYAGRFLSNIGDCYYDLDSLDKAFSYQSDVLKMMQALNNNFSKAIILKKLSKIELKRLNYNEGLGFAVKSTNLLKGIEEYKLEYQRSLRVLSQNYIGLKKYSEALKVINEAIGISKKLQNIDDEIGEIAENYLVKSVILNRVGNFSEADNYLTLSKEYKDSVDKKHKNKVLRIFKERYHQEKLKNELSKIEIEYQQTYFLLFTLVIVLILITLIFMLVANKRMKKMNKLLSKQKKELELLNELFNSFFENTNRAIRVTNKNNQIIFWNKAAEKLSGFKKEEVIGKVFNEVIDADFMFIENPDSTINHFKNHLSITPNEFKKNGNGLSKNLILTIRSKDRKKKHIFDSKFLIETSSEQYIGGITDDITDNKENELQLIDAMQKLEAADKLKSEFLAQMSHEIRTPVNTILSFISLIKEETKNIASEDINTSFKMVEHGSQRLIRTIDLILDMSQLQSGTFETKNKQINLVEDILIPLSDEYRYKADNKGIKFKYQNNIMESVTIEIDEYLITQVLINLLDNAIKYTEVGSVSVVLYKNENEFVAIDVIDTGIGMNKDFMKNLFIPFRQEEQGYTRSYEGNGLGLSLVKKYCELLNAEIKVLSEKGVGSVFTIELKNKT